MRRRRAQLRERRHKPPSPTVALVGYTNAGKTTLFNALTGDAAVASDALFVTLDPLVRKVKLPDRRELLVSDTVGFIERLPHSLVAAFRATLEEVAAADLLLHVIDASSAGARPPHRRRPQRARGGRRRASVPIARGLQQVRPARRPGAGAGPGRLSWRAVRLGVDRRRPRRADRRARRTAGARHGGRDASSSHPTTKNDRERIAHLYRVGRIRSHVATDGHVSIEAEVPSRAVDRLRSAAHLACRRGRADHGPTAQAFVVLTAVLLICWPRLCAEAAGGAGSPGRAQVCRLRVSRSRRPAGPRDLAGRSRRHGRRCRPATAGARSAVTRRCSARRASIRRTPALATVAHGAQ